MLIQAINPGGSIMTEWPFYVFFYPKVYSIVQKNVKIQPTKALVITQLYPSIRHIQGIIWLAQPEASIIS
ncbi:MAG: hypothetical protein ACI934_001025 [Pseudohongiellaceae bacterium]|jgi:hypothetical protein